MTLTQIKHRLMRLLGRALLLAVQEQSGRQRLTLRVQLGDQREGVERLQQYGHHSWPPAHCDIVFAALGASAQHTVALCAQDPKRPPLAAPGDAGIYSVGGNQVTCHADGTITVRPAPGKPLIFDAKVARFTGDIAAAGLVSADKDVVTGAVSLLKHKTGGVTPGAGVSGGPVP